MRLSFLILSLSCCQHLLQPALGDDISVTRHVDGDVFTIPGSCNEACMVLSSGTASPYGFVPSALAGRANKSCTCQCNYGLPVFREDLRICVDSIQECEVAGFASGSGLVERVPYVFLPRYGQIIYPQAEIKFEEVEAPVCVITGVQQLGRNGWSELRNISDVEFPLSLYRDEKRTFLQWTGEPRLHETAEGKVLMVRLACRESDPNAAYRGVVTPCLTFRVAGSPSRSSIKEVSFSPSGPRPQGLTSAEYAAIGLSSALLALVYVASVSLYLHGRKRKSRTRDEEEDDIEAANRRSERSCEPDTPGLVKCNPLLAVGGRSHNFESDSNSAVSEAELADKLLGSGNSNDADSELDNLGVTSAIIHPHEDYNEPPEQNCNSGSIIGERLPEEDVRVVETTENASQQNVPVFPGTQRRKLYFNPAYFDRQLLLAPPPAAIEFLLKIREVISIAKHKMAAKRFVPSLNEIPEESSSDRHSGSSKARGKRRANSAQGLPKNRRPLRCEGCPGCSHGSSTPNLPGSRGLATDPISGESRVRAWLEDVKLLDARWRGLDDEVALRGQLRHAPRHEHDAESARLSSRSLPLILGEVPLKRLKGNCVNEALEDEGGTDRSVKQNEWTGRNGRREHEDSLVNANVRRAIENSFRKQLEMLQTGKDAVVKGKTNGRTAGRNGDAEKNQAVANKSAGPKMQEVEETRVLLNIINDELSGRSNSDAKRIMDAVIQELVITKEKEREATTKASDYETDSLEKTRISRKSSSSPVSTDKSSPALSSALPINEELTMRNAIIDVQISETTSTNNSSVVKNHNLPEVVPLRPENYALVSEVYVNNGYTSPAGSDEDSGPEIQYEPENPGHLTIRVVDSPKNYIKQDESEYEPDTLDRKPMKLKINGDVSYDKHDNTSNEIYIDSLERTSQILLRSKSSFRQEIADEKDESKPPRTYSSLREIYEARLKYQQQLSQEAEKSRGSCKCTSPLLPRQERRQRKADNQPDVVPKPPPPPPPPPVQNESHDGLLAKNARDRRFSEAGDPTACEDAPVGEAAVVGRSSMARRQPENSRGEHSSEQARGKNRANLNGEQKSPARGPTWPANPDDSAYTSSPESSGSRRRLLGPAAETGCGCGTESDESTSGAGGCCSEHVANSESGAESVETDSVFFGNFRKIDNANQQPTQPADLHRPVDSRSFQIKSRAC